MIATKFLVLLIFFTQTGFAHLDPVRPSSSQTPGSLCTTEDPDFKEFRYSEKIAYCRRNVSTSTKTDIYLSYGVDLKNRSKYSIDHLIPLSIGGTNKFNNLWPEPKSIKALRANLEFYVYQKLKRGQITREQAINEILTEKLNPPVFSTHYLEY